MPTADGTAVATTAYYVNDLVAAQEVPGHERTTWTLDPLQRFSEQDTFAWVNGAWANSIESVNHYDGDSDEPAWITEDITQPDKVSRYVEGADGNIAVQTAKTGGRVLQLVDLHGDITATLPIPDAQPNADYTALTRTAFDEFGVPQPLTSGATSNAPPARYGWLGAAQRSADTPTGTILMGVRLYAPTLGRFVQVDPVPGGSANAYDYCNADPINCTDLGGTFTWKGLAKAVAAVGEVASIIPGPVGAAAGAVAAGAYLAAGDKQAALWAAAGAAAALVGAGAAVAAVKVTRLARVGQLAVGAVAKKERAVVIGRTMTRVHAAAEALGADTYQAWRGYSRVVGPAGARFQQARKRIANTISYFHNKAWIASVKRSGATVYDIGRDVSRRSTGRYYRMERRTMRGAPNHVKVYWPGS